MSSAQSKLPVVLAITGASGAVYGARLLESLLCLDRPVYLTMSSSGQAVIKQELGVTVKNSIDGMKSLLKASDAFLKIDGQAEVNAEAAEARMAEYLSVYQPNDYFTPIASGSSLTAGMVVCPCSGATLSGIAHAASQNLIQRAAEVHLKERRKLILVPRETPLSVLQLENMQRVSQAGAVVVPAAPGWYHGVNGLVDLVDFMVARVLDLLGISNDRMQRWTEHNNEPAGN